MTDISEPPITVDGNLYLFDHHLCRVSGALEEIATVWRRAGPRMPDLPIDLPTDLPMQLASSTRQLAEMVKTIVDTGPGQPQDVAVLVTEQLSVLKRDIAAAQAMTCGADIPSVGDAALWKFVSTAIHRAENRLLSLIPQRY